MQYLEYRSVSDLNKLIISKLGIFPHDIDLVVGIPRSGMLPANLIALYLNKPYTDIDSFIQGKIYLSGERGSCIKVDDINKVLIVDDSIYWGNAILQAKKKLQQLPDHLEFKYAAIIVTSAGSKLVDYFCEIIDRPRIFQWNIFHHSIISRSCFDIDGVLCQDPQVDDDGPIYKAYISHAIPLYTPTVEIDTLISCRLEKYRNITEQWLAEHKIKYKHLILLDFENREKRIAWGKYGRYKGELYKKSDNILFVESSLQQAIEISKISNKPVFCTETFEMINYNPNIKKISFSVKYKVKNILYDFAKFLKMK